MYLEIVSLYLYSYLVGAIPTSYVIARLVKGIDLRQYGSGNVGGSNVARQLGKKWVAPVVVIEILLKGFSPVVAAYLLLVQVSGLDRISVLFYAAPLLALIGNNWSVFLHFQGGRGLMVVCGGLIGVVPLIFVAGIAIYFVGWRVTRSSGIWALIALAALPILAQTPGGYLLVDWPGLWLWLAGRGWPETTANAANVISWYCIALLALVIAKRIVANNLSYPEDLPRKKVFLNRLIHDRDVDDRTEWVNRVPE